MKQAITLHLLWVALLSVMLGGRAALADAEDQRALVNRGTIKIVTGSLTDTSLRLVNDLADAFDEGYDVRITPVLGRGSMRAVEDLLFLQDVDIATVHSDVLDFYRKHDLVPDVDERIRYVARLCSEEVHILARAEFRTLDDLQDRRVNFGTEDGGTFRTAGILFAALGINIEVTTHTDLVALTKLSAGEIDAMVFIGGQPVPLVQKLKAEDGLRLLAVPSYRLNGIAYEQASLTAGAYPALIEPDDLVLTVAVGTFLMARNLAADDPEQAVMKQFIDGFFADSERLLQSPFHPKWRQMDLKAELPGWQRLPMAEQALAASQ